LCRELSRCLYSLSSAGDVCWAKPNHAFSDCQHLRSIFFQAGGHGVIAVAGPSGASSDSDDADALVASPARISQTAFFKGFAKTHPCANTFDATSASMRSGRDGPSSRVCEAAKKNLRRRPRFASHNPDLRESARTPKTIRPCFDDCPTRSRTIASARRRHLRDALDATRRSSFLASDAAGRRHSTRTPNVSGIREDVAAPLSDGRDADAHRTVTFRNDPSVAQKQNRPHMAAGR